MSQGLLHSDALAGVKSQHAVQQVKSCFRQRLSVQASCSQVFKEKKEGYMTG